MTIQEIKNLIALRIKGQGNQVDSDSIMPKILIGMLEFIGSTEDSIGELASLDTDHKSNLVDAINEVADALETEELVVSMTQTNAERKAIYDLCVNHLQLAKNIVFYQPLDQLYYRVNGYNMVNGALKLHVIAGNNSVVATIASNGSISVA